MLRSNKHAECLLWAKAWGGPWRYKTNSKAPAFKELPHFIRKVDTSIFASEVSYVRNKTSRDLEMRRVRWLMGGVRNGFTFDFGY